MEDRPARAGPDARLRERAAQFGESKVRWKENSESPGPVCLEGSQQPSLSATIKRCLLAGLWGMAILTKARLRRGGFSATATIRRAKDVERIASTAVPGTVTMADVAKLAGVSSATVSRALAHSPVVNEETRKRVLEVVKQSGYRINRNAQRLREKRANAIAVVSDSVASTARQVGAPTMAHTLLSETVKALATREKAVLLLPPDGASLPRCRSLLAEQFVDGLIFLTSRDKELTEQAVCSQDPAGCVGRRSDSGTVLRGHRRRGAGRSACRAASRGCGMQCGPVCSLRREIRSRQPGWLGCQRE